MVSMKKKGSTNGVSNLVASLFLGFFLITCTIGYAVQPSFYEPADFITMDCSPSSPDFAMGVRLDASVVSRVYALDPANRERPKVSACIFRKPFTYPFYVSDGPGPKFVRLWFKPLKYAGLNISKALFSVSSGQHTLITTSESSYSGSNILADYAIREFCIRADGQVLNVTFTPSLGTSGAYAFVNRIEVISMPSNLYIQENVPIPLAGQPSPYSMGNSTALEKMYRLNVGGSLIPELEDTGMFRTWTSDDYYLTGSLATTINSEVEINLTSLTPPYAAPIQLYSSAREAARAPESKYIPQWAFPVDSGFYYLVRFHFCEILRAIHQDGQRVFHIYINNQSVEDHADVFRWSHGSGFPIYRDYIVNFSRHDGIKYLSIAVGSSIESSTRSSGAILNGLEIFKLSDLSGNLAGSFPFGTRTEQDINLEPKSRKVAIFASVVKWIFGLTVCGSMALSFLYLVYESLPSGFKHGRQTTQGQSSENCRKFSLVEMKSATNNFADSLLIGNGGFGMVYKGSIDGGTTNVAIKRANPSSHQGLQEFQTEISMLSKLRHRHLVSLIGYSMQDKEMILVYDYMAQGTLRDHLYNSLKPRLSWTQRLKICIGAARGLHYLHTGAKHTIIHRDIKTTNILLDDKWVAKVADFGLSKIGPNAISQSKTHVSTIVKGSFGYLDPEYYRRQKLTEKSDVYSFGVVLFEVLCARPAVIPMGEIEEEEHEKVCLAEWALHCCRRGILDQIIDPYLKGKITPECLETFTGTARKCLAERGTDRPSMGDVLWSLETALKQQEGSDPEEGSRAHGETNGRLASGLSVMIDGQKCLQAGNSDPTPGVEFSEIMVPRGR